jgi:putative methionine-R-sulfoxide reductase with GAF domain
MRTAAGTRVVGVLDLDSTVLATFDEEDLEGLAGVVRILEEKSVWPFA